MTAPADWRPMPETTKAPKAPAWEILADVRGETFDPILGERFEFTAKAGSFTPKGDRDVSMLEHLFGIGYARRPDGTAVLSPGKLADDAAAEAAEAAAAAALEEA